MIVASFAVQPGHNGIVYNRIGGLNETKVMTEGLNFVIPWFQRAIIYDVRTRPQLINSQSGSKGMMLYITCMCIILLIDMSSDLQMVQIGIRVLYRPSAKMFPNMYRLLGQGVLV